jgi:hypothetical protein
MGREIVGVRFSRPWVKTHGYVQPSLRDSRLWLLRRPWVKTHGYVQPSLRDDPVALSNAARGLKPTAMFNRRYATIPSPSPTLPVG